MTPTPTASALVVTHAPPERAYAVGTALESAGVPVRVCRTWAGDRLPDTLDGTVGLVVMGGPMAAYDDFPGRARELALLRAALDAGTPVLGICLGAQLLAVAAGGTARPGDGRPQIGWGEVGVSDAAADDPLFTGLPARLGVLHWHSDTMDLPPGATVLASCSRFPVQAFRVGSAAWGLQFHLEVDEEAVHAFAATFPDDAAHAPGLIASTPAALAALRPHRDDVVARFAALVARNAVGVGSGGQRA